MSVYEDRVSLEPSGCMAFLGGLRGEKRIPFRAITAVQMKEAGLTGGYIQFTIGGGNERQGGFLAASNDENSFIFAADNNKLMRQVRDYIEQRIGPAASVAPPAVAPAQPSLSDELVKLSGLLEKGLISQSEFEKAKTKLLK